jgi:hypothetical protein
MPETDLYKRIEELESENHILRTENKRLKEALGLPTENVIQEQETIAVEKESIRLEIVSSVNKYSSPNEKIKLFLSLFRGRTDVYAKRCYSKKFNSSYYIPACKFACNSKYYCNFVPSSILIKRI